MKRKAPGLKRSRTDSIQAKRDAAVLPKDASLRQDHARAEIIVDALDVADGTALAVDRAEPDRIALGRICFPWLRLAGIDPGRQGVEIGPIEQGGRFDLHAFRIADAVAVGEGKLGRFDGRMDMGKSIGLRNLQTLHQRQDHQRCQPLRRRLVIEHPDARQIDGKQIAGSTGVIGEIAGSQG